MRRIQIVKLKALTKSTHPDHLDDFIIHVKDEYDYIFICKRREEVISAIQECYFKLKNKQLPVYAVDDEIQQFLTTKADSRDNIEKLPPQKFLVPAEEDNRQKSNEEIQQACYYSGLSIDDEDRHILPEKGRSARHSTIYAKQGSPLTTIEDFEILSVIGRGGFGKVFLVKNTISGKFYAMKA